MYNLIVMKIIYTTLNSEVVLIIKTIEGKYKEIETVIKQHINFDNFIGELNVKQINSSRLY